MPNFVTITMLSIILPLASVLCTICVCVCPLAVGSVVQPITYVDIAVWMTQLPKSIYFIVFPLATVHSTILPVLLSLAIA